MPLVRTERPSSYIALYRWLLSLALTDRAIGLGDTRDLSKATADMEMARDLCVQTLKEKPDDDQSLFQSACIDHQQADLILKFRVDPVRAETLLTQSAHALEKLIDANKTTPSYQEQMAMTLSSRAEARLVLGNSRLVDAQKDCEAAQRLVKNLIDREKQKGIVDNPSLFGLLARVLERLSRVSLARGDKAAARRTLTEAVENLTICERLDPSRLRDISDLAK